MSHKFNYDRAISQWRRRLPRHLRDCVRFGHAKIIDANMTMNNGDSILIIIPNSDHIANIYDHKYPFIVFTRQIRSLPVLRKSIFTLACISVFYEQKVKVPVKIMQAANIMRDPKIKELNACMMPYAFYGRILKAYTRMIVWRSNNRTCVVENNRYRLN